MGNCRSPKNVAIRAEGLSKLYRIGLKDRIHDNFVSAFVDMLKAPYRNYRKYRSLYRFDDVGRKERGEDDSDDVIWALRDVSFDILRGEAVGIIGRNGAGKSTLLKILSRVTDPTHGCVRIRGRISSLLEVGTGFHQELTGRENVYLNGTILGMTKREVDRKFDEIVDFSGIHKFIDTPVKRYSSGMRVRLAFSVAAHLEPDILIVDEVLAVGDADFQKKCLNKMEDVGKKGRTVLFVSHNMQAITRLCSRAILIGEGRILKEGPAPNIVRSYLTADSGTSAERKWADPAKAPRGDWVRLMAVRSIDGSGQVAESFGISDPIGLQMEYWVRRGGRMLLPHFHLFNDEGIKLFISLDLDENWRGKERPSGRYRSTAWIPGNLLTEGMFYVHANLLALRPEEPEFSAPDAVSFIVVDRMEGTSARGDWRKRLPGVIRPMLKWETDFEPETGDGKDQ
jgi:lipopolysaccharide transport system ATP-binding protein